MSAFTTELDGRYIDGRRWQLLAPFRYDLGELGGPESVIVPMGFVTDFASIPQVLWNVFPPTGQYGKAAVVHDFLYRCRVITTVQTGVVRFCTKAEADTIFSEAMQVLGVGAWTRRLLYWGVRVGGGATWARYRKQEQSDGTRG